MRLMQSAASPNAPVAIGGVEQGIAFLSGGGADPLAPGAPSVDLVTGSDTGSSSADNITNDTTPDLDILLARPAVIGDVIDLRDGASTIFTHTVTSGEVGDGTITSGLSALSEGLHSFSARHTSGGHISAWGSVLGVTIDTTAPTISTASTASNAENSVLAIALAANETVSWSITGGADQALFEISGTTLRWASNGTKNFESPNDADTNNTYIVQVTATDAAGNATNKTITVTVANVNEAPTVANAIADQNATQSSAFSFQFASNVFSDPDSGDTLTYSATKSDGSALPAWLTFTAGTRTFSGTPALGDIGTLSVKVTATDTGSLAVTNTFNIIVGAAGGLSKGILYNNGYAENLSGLTTYTFNNVPIGAADANRQSVIVLGIRSTNVISITSVTFDDGGGGGARSMSKVVERNSASVADTSLWQIGSTHGTTATIVVTLANAAVRVAIDSFSVITATPTVSATNTSAASNPTTSLTNPSNAAGTIVASCCAPGIGASATPTGYTERHDANIGATTASLTCGEDNLPAAGAKTYTVTWSATPTGPNGVFATWAQ